MPTLVSTPDDCRKECENYRHCVMYAIRLPLIGGYGFPGTKCHLWNKSYMTIGAVVSYETDYTYTAYTRKVTKDLVVDVSASFSQNVCLEVKSVD